MKHISKYIFSICLVLSSFLVHAQETPVTKSISTSGKTAAPIADKKGKKPADDKKPDSIAVKYNRYGLRLGLDLFKLSRSFYEKDYKGLEIVGDYRLTKKYYLAGELGNENKTVNGDQLSFTTKGTYFKAGFDFNAYENWLDMENKIYIGLRYGVSSFSQRLNTYKIYDAHPYFDDAPVVESNQKFDGLTAQWVEVVLGVNAKVYNNIYVGFSFRLNNLVSSKKPENFDNLYIPGFNRTYNGNFGVGFNYTVSYLVPLYKKKVIIVAKKAEKKKKR